MAGLLSWLGGDQAEISQEPSPELSASVYVTRTEMMDALKKLQSQVEDRFRAERTKRAQRFEKLSVDVAKRFAEVEGNLLHEIFEQSKASPDGPVPSGAERFSQALTPRQPRPEAMVVVSAASSLGPSVIDTDSNVLSEVFDGRKTVEELKSKVEFLETFTKSLVTMARASTNHRPDGTTTDGAATPQQLVACPADNLSNMPGESVCGGSADQVQPWTPKLDTLESDMLMLSRRVIVVEVKMGELEQQLDVRVHALIKQAIQGLGP